MCRRPILQNRGTSAIIQRLFVFLIIALGVFWLFRRRAAHLARLNAACIQEEWQENAMIKGTQDRNDVYRISFANVQREFKWMHIPTFRQGDEPTEILMIVSSNSDSFSRRNVIRRTWMSSPMNHVIRSGRMRALFLIGVSETDRQLNAVLMKEAQVFGDMIVINLHDTYSNLPYKSLSTLLFGTSKSPNSVKLIGKIDEDVIFYPDQLASLIDDGHINLTSCAVYGKKYDDGVAVNRAEDGGKWNVPEELYKCSVYPSYLSGPAYFVTRDAANRILTASKHRKFILVEDVFITGLLAGDVGVEKQQLPYMYMVEDATTDGEKSQLLAWHTNKNDFQYEISFDNLRFTRCKACLRQKSPAEEESSRSY